MYRGNDTTCVSDQHLQHCHFSWHLDNVKRKELIHAVFVVFVRNNSKSLGPKPQLLAGGSSSQLWYVKTFEKEIFVTQNLPIASLCWSGCVVLAWWGDPLIALTSRATSRAQRREKEGGWGGDFATIGDKTPDSDQFLSWSVANTSAGTNTSEATFKMIFVRKRYLSSIPWVRCASSNVLD